MGKNHIKFYSILGGIIVLISVFLWSEIKNYQSITVQTTNEPLIAISATPIEILPSDQILGNPGAPLTIIEFLDLNDSKSRKLNNEIVDFVTRNPQKARLIFKHAPVTGFFSDRSEVNIAAYCAGVQNKLWSFLINLTKTNDAGLKEAASNSDINLNTWQSCLNGEGAKKSVSKDTEIAKQMNLGKPPLIFFNNKKINTELDFSLTDFLSTLISE